MDDLDEVVGQHLVDGAVGAGQAELGGALRAMLRRHLHEPADRDAEPAQRLDVHGADEPAADDGGADVTDASHAGLPGGVGPTVIQSSRRLDDILATRRKGHTAPPRPRDSNLGYGILGRVITNVAGMEYRDVVEARLLGPLGMAATSYLPDSVPGDLLASGYVRRDEQWEPEPIAGYGALASMGGLLTSVEDLARWVAGLADAFPARDDPDGAHPLCRASRREMQQVHRPLPPELAFDGAGGSPTLTAGGYGMGLFVVTDLEIGTTVGHGGGYPGFGSHMRWHPGTGLGVVALANARYAQVHGPTEEALRTLVRSGAVPPRRVRASASTERLRQAADRLLLAWDDDLADSVFAANMDLDLPRALRRAEVEQARERLGRWALDDEEPTSDSPSHVRWRLRGELGRLRVGLLASAEAEPRIQSLRILVVPDPSPALAALAERVAGLLASDPPRWPDDLATAPGVEPVDLERGLRAAALRLGRVTVGRPLAGDGERVVTAEVHGESGRGELRLEVDDAGRVSRAVVVPAAMAAPLEAP